MFLCALTLLSITHRKQALTLAQGGRGVRHLEMSWHWFGITGCVRGGRGSGRSPALGGGVLGGGVLGGGVLGGGVGRKRRRVCGRLRRRWMRRRVRRHRARQRVRRRRTRRVRRRLARRRRKRRLRRRDRRRFVGVGVERIGSAGRHGGPRGNDGGCASGRRRRSCGSGGSGGGGCCVGRQSRAEEGNHQAEKGRPVNHQLEKI